MAEREQLRKPSQNEPQETPETSHASTEQGAAISAELDELLDEIDEVLETNAEEFVKSYVQKGGQ